MAQYVFLRLAAPIVGRLPRQLLSWLGAFAGVVAYVFARNARNAVQRNLAVVLPERPDRERRRIAVQVFIHAAWGYVETLRLASVNPDEIITRFPFIGRRYLDDALARGQGVIMISAHLGASTAAAQTLALRGLPIHVLVESMRPPALHRLIKRLRGRFGLGLVEADRSAVRPMMAALRHNEIVGFMCDRDVVGTGAMLPFFGRETRVTEAPATFARRTGAIVLPVVAYRTGLFAGVARLEEPVEMPRTADVAADVREGTLRIMARVERLIREHPEQWVVFEDLWPSGTIPRSGQTPLSPWERPARSAE